MERLEFSSWTWWCDSGGSVPWETFHGGFLDGLGLRGPKGHFSSYFAPFRRLLVRFLVKFSIIAAVPFFYAMCGMGICTCAYPGGVYSSLSGAVCVVYSHELRSKISCLWLTEHSV